MKARVLIDGFARGELLRLSEPLSFWGGIDPHSGTIIDARHPQHGRSVTATVLAMPGARGSSSSSSVLLELIARCKAPAAILLGEPDAILALGAVVAREMGWRPPPVLALPAEAQARLPEGILAVTEGGVLRPG